MSQAKTIKQAKAAYKTRNTANPLTEREQKQLQRSVQLDRRAWSLREREKNRADAVKKRAEKGKKAHDEEKRLGTQMRCDKFGHKSSQFHLGAFFGKGAGVKKDIGIKLKDLPTDEPTLSPKKHDYDEFDDVDDESLLKALDSPEADRKVDTTSFVKSGTSLPKIPSVRNMMPPPPRPFAMPPKDLSISTAERAAIIERYAPAQARTELRHPVHSEPLPTQDLDILWNDFLSTSTQIARELGADDCEQRETAVSPPKPRPSDDLRMTSFSSGLFDLTEEDLEELDPTPRARLHHANTDFTLTQLESFMDDDLQLTQIDTH